jgi:hypothetical protein
MLERYFRKSVVFLLYSCVVFTATYAQSSLEAFDTIVFKNGDHISLVRTVSSREERPCGNS